MKTYKRAISNRRQKQAAINSKVKDALRGLTPRTAKLTYDLSHDIRNVFDNDRNAYVKAMQTVADLVDSFGLPSRPRFSLCGMVKNATAGDGTITDGMIKINAVLNTLMGHRASIDIPVIVKDKNIVEPAVFFYDGTPYVMCKPAFDQLIKRGSLQRDVASRALYSPPVDGVVAEAEPARQPIINRQHMFSPGSMNPWRFRRYSQRSDGKCNCGAPVAGPGANYCVRCLDNMGYKYENGKYVETRHVEIPDDWDVLRKSSQKQIDLLSPQVEQERNAPPKIPVEQMVSELEKMQLSEQDANNLKMFKEWLTGKDQKNAYAAKSWIKRMYVDNQQYLDIGKSLSEGVGIEPADEPRSKYQTIDAQVKKPNEVTSPQDLGACPDCGGKGTHTTTCPMGKMVTKEAQLERSLDIQEVQDPKRLQPTMSIDQMFDTASKLELAPEYAKRVNMWKRVYDRIKAKGGPKTEDDEIDLSNVKVSLEEIIVNNQQYMDIGRSISPALGVEPKERDWRDPAHRYQTVDASTKQAIELKERKKVQRERTNIDTPTEMPELWGEYTDDQMLDPAERNRADLCMPGCEVSLTEDFEVRERGGAQLVIPSGEEGKVVVDVKGDGMCMRVNFPVMGIDAVVPVKFLKVSSKEGDQRPFDRKAQTDTELMFNNALKQLSTTGSWDERGSKRSKDGLETLRVAFDSAGKARLLLNEEVMATHIIDAFRLNSDNVQLVIKDLMAKGDEYLDTYNRTHRTTPKTANWFTHVPIEKALASGMADMCPHVAKDKSLAYNATQESDSFGPGDIWIECKECSDKRQQEKDNRTRVCNDCKKKVRQADGREWRWYDFYEAQGDEPLFICNECAGAPKHKQRVRQDRLEYKREMGQEGTEGFDDRYAATIDQVKHEIREMLREGYQTIDIEAAIKQKYPDIANEALNKDTQTAN